MQKQLECTKIKDGLYLGNVVTAHDAEFLLTNKFAFVVNCAAEVPNLFEAHGIRYLKFKLTREKPHRLWDATLKKLHKLSKFVQTCEQNSMCCLIHSFDGANRSVAMLAALLMSRYRWTLGKTLEFVRSKQIFIGLSEHYIEQLEQLEAALESSEPPLSSQWRIEYRSIDEEIVSKTFLNSQEIDGCEPADRPKKERRVQWKDLVEKERRREQKLMVKEQQRERGVKFADTVEDKITINLTKVEEKQNKKHSKPQQFKEKISSKKLKVTGNKSKPEIALHQSEKQNQRSLDKFRERDSKKGRDGDEVLDEGQLIKLIAGNLKAKRTLEAEDVENEGENEERVYNVTINNFIKPSINILSGLGLEKKKPKKRPQSASTWKKAKPF